MHRSRVKNRKSIKRDPPFPFVRGKKVNDNNKRATRRRATTFRNHKR